MKPMEADLKTIKALDAVLSQAYKPVKDSSKDTDCGVYTKTYEVLTTNNPHPVLTKIRLWFNERENRGTIKVRKIPYSLISAAGSYTLLQAGILIQQVLIAPK